MTLGDPDHPAELVLPDGLSGPDLLQRVRGALEAAASPDGLCLVGHGTSGVAVLSLCLHQRRLGIRVAQAVCVGSVGGDDPVSGRPLDAPTRPRTTTRITLVPGTDPASAAWTAATADAWTSAGWSVTLTVPVRPEYDGS